MPFFLLLSNIYFIGILSSWCQSHSASLIFLWHRQEMSASQALVSHCQGSSRCLGNLYFFPPTLSQGTREREIRAEACGKGKKRILVMWQVKKRKEIEPLLLCTADGFVHRLVHKFTGDSPGWLLRVTHLAPLIEIPITDSAQTAALY